MTEANVACFPDACRETETVRSRETTRGLRSILMRSEAAEHSSARARIQSHRAVATVADAAAFKQGQSL